MVVYIASIVLIHLLVSFAHGYAHRELGIALSMFQSMFVFIVILILPVIAMVFTWTAWKRSGLILLALSMAASLLFGLYYHFLAAGPDNVHSQPASSLGTTFALTSYGVLITEAIGAYLGIHFLRNGFERARIRSY
jgi:hypothetical protein